MGDARRITRLIADPYLSTSLSGRLRERRWREFLRRFPDLSSMRVVDLGGTAAYWRKCPVRPAGLVLVNLFAQEAPWRGARSLVGDACAPAADLRGERFDLVVSNSVIGHVGGHARRAQFAATVHELSEHHWVQTPYRYFPVEPCYVCAGVQFLPVCARAKVSMLWPFGHRHARTHRDAVEMALSVELLSFAGFRHYFPHSEVWRERVAGVTKSLVAVR